MYNNVMQLENKVKNCFCIPWDTLKTYEFNTLKDENRDVSKLKNSIVNDNFNFPFYVWAGHRFIVDGSGRRQALQELQDDGYIIPDLPIVEIEASSKQHAKKLVLSASSRYGEITQNSYNEFIEDIDLELEDINVDIHDIASINTGYVSGEQGIYDDTDYSQKNQEIDVSDFDDKMSLVLKYSYEEYTEVTSKLREIAGTPEQAVCKLLGIM